MASTLEIVLRARDEASAKLKAARGEVAKTQSVIAALSPQLAATTSRFEGMAAAAGALGPAGIAIAGVGAGMAALAVSAGLAIHAVDQLASSAEQLGNLSQKTGVAVETLQGLQFAFKNAGVEAGALNTGLRFLAKNIAEGAPELAQLGITTKDVGEAFFQLSDKFHGSEDGANKSAFAMALLGRAGTELIPVLNSGAEALREQQREAAAMGKILGGDAVVALKAADTALDEMKNRVEGLKVQVTLLAVPLVTELVGGLNALLRIARELPSPLATLQASFRALVATLPTGPALLVLLRLLALVKNAKDEAGPLPGFDAATGAPAGQGEAGPKNQLPPPGAGGGESIHDWVRRQGADGTGTARLKEMKKEILEIGEAVQVAAVRFGELGESFNVLEDFRDMVAGVLDASNILGETLNSVWASLENSLTSVFQGILQRGQTFRAALGQIFHGLVDAILGELARLAAASIFKLFLKLTGIALGGVPGVVAGVASSSMGFAPAGASSAAAAGPMTQVFISALDSQSLDDSYRSSGGAFRVHEGRAAARRRW